MLNKVEPSKETIERMWQKLRDSGRGCGDCTLCCTLMAVAGIIEKNPYWPDYAERADRFADIRSKKS